MAQAAAAALGPNLGRGFLLTKDHHIDEAARLGLEKNFVLREASHPVPDQRGHNATLELIDWLESAPNDGRALLVLTSGGTSSLLVAPTEPLTLTDLADLNRAMLSSGLPIERMNILRKHVSGVKGGQLSDRCTLYRTVQQLLMVDICAPQLKAQEVLSLVGSGPLVADPSEAQVAREVLEVLRARLSAEVFERASKAIHETPFETSVETQVLGSYETLTDTAEALLADRLIKPAGWDRTVTGKVQEVAQRMAEVALQLQREGRSGVLVASGEPTVDLGCDPPGQGGRCQELALHFSRHIAGLGGISLLAGSSDGTDGPTDCAGAFVDSQTWPTLSQKLGQSRLDEMLQRHDSGSALAHLAGALITTGPTGQNLNDLYLIEIEANPGAGAIPG